MSRPLATDELPAELSLRELVVQAAHLVDAMGLVPVDGRAARHPDARAVRYYVGLGLVDRPLGYRGNAALYGRRHLLQLLAIKALQAQGLGLPDVQRQLLGRSTEQLRSLLPPLRRVAPPPPPLPPRSAPSEASWKLELELAPGVRLQVDPSALTHLDPDRLADALRLALRTAPMPAPVPEEEQR
jgi:DNA-binding transcriptional MerR regulator